MTLMPSSDDPFFRILCVDDNSTMLQMLKLGFGVYGFEVVTASHGIDALMQF
jgi:CheY-like chemotaxis protein